VSAANYGDLTSVTVSMREGKMPKRRHHMHESRFTDHRFTLLLDLEFAEKGSEVYAKA
jgi:hypothetical protein